MEESRKDIPVEEKIDYVYCPYCRARNSLPDNWENDLQNVYCSSCRNPFASFFISSKIDENSYKTCSNCHMKNMIGAKFCTKCGNEHFKDDESIVIPSDNSLIRRRLDSKEILCGIFISLSVLGMILAWFFGQRASSCLTKIILIFTFFIFCALLILSCIACLVMIFTSFYDKRKKLKEEV